MMSFDEVRAYLSSRARNPDAVDRGEHDVGSLSLDQVRQRVMQSETQVQGLLRGLTLKREREMAGELRGLQVRQQNARANRSQQEAEIRALITDLEQKKELELRHRLDKERIEQAVKQAKDSDMKLTEKEKKTELERLAKERKTLESKERELQKEIDKLQDHLVNQEVEAREKSKIAQDVLNEGKLHPRKHTQERLIDLACARGQRAAQLELEKSQLQQQRNDLVAKLSSIRGPGSKNPKFDESTGSSGSNKTLTESKGNENTDAVDDLVHKISGNLTAEERRIDQLRADMESDRKRHEEIELEFNQLSQEASRHLKPPPLADEISSFLKPTDGHRQPLSGALQALNQINNASPLDEQLDQYELTGQRYSKGTLKRSPTARAMRRQQSRVRIQEDDEKTVAYEDNRTETQNDDNRSVFSAKSRKNIMQEEEEENEIAEQWQAGLQRTGTRKQLHKSRSLYLQNAGHSSMHSPRSPSRHAASSENDFTAEHIDSLKEEYARAGSNNPELWQQIMDLEHLAVTGKSSPSRGQQQQQHRQAPAAASPAPYWPPSGPLSPGIHSAWPNPIQPTQYMGSNVDDRDSLLQSQQDELERLSKQIEDATYSRQNDAASSQRVELTEALNRIGEAVSTFASTRAGPAMMISSPDGGNPNRGNGGGPGNGGGMGELSQFMTEQANAIKALNKLPKESHIYRMQVQHMQDMAKMKFEIDSLLQRKRLVRLRDELTREEAEAKRDAEHTRWKKEQSRQLAEAKIRRVLAKESGNLNSGIAGHIGANQNDEEMSPYDPQDGFMVYFDYCLRLPKRISHVRLVYCFYDGAMPRTKPKALPLAECELETQILKSSIFAARRHFKRVAANSNLRLVVEVQSVTPAVNESGLSTGASAKSQSIGWTAIKLFSHKREAGTQLISKLSKFKLSKPPLDTELFEDAERFANDVHHRSEQEDEVEASANAVQLFLRTVNFAHADKAADFTVDPQLTSHQYKFRGEEESHKERRASYGYRDEGDHDRGRYHHNYTNGEEEGHRHERGRERDRHPRDRRSSKAHEHHGDDRHSVHPDDEKEQSDLDDRQSRVGYEEDGMHSPVSRSKSPGQSTSADHESQIAASDITRIISAKRNENALGVKVDFATLIEGVDVLDSFSSYRVRVNIVSVNDLNLERVLEGSVYPMHGASDTTPQGYDVEAKLMQIAWNERVVVWEKHKLVPDMLLVLQLLKSTDPEEVTLVAWGVQRLGIYDTGVAASDSVSLGPRTIRLHYGTHVRLSAAEEYQEVDEMNGTPNDDFFSVELSEEYVAASAHDNQYHTSSSQHEDEKMYKEGEEEDDENSEEDEEEENGAPQSRRKKKSDEDLDGWKKVVHVLPKGVELGGHSSLFVRGDDGYDVYVDAARFLPDNTTITCVQAKVLTLDYELVGEVQVTYPSLDESAYSPKFKGRVEYRGEDVANPTSTLVLRIDGVDRYTKDTSVFGYSVLNIFCEPDGSGAQPSKAIQQEYVLNAGSFQLPLFRSSPDQTKPLTNGTFELAPRVPCATLLVRIVPATKSKDGLTTLSTADYEEHEWEPRRLVVNAPEYLDGAYDSTRCIPLRCERILYPFRTERGEPLIREVVMMLADSGADRNFTRDDLEALEDDALAVWVQENLKAPNGIIDSHRLAEYQAEVGFKVGVERIINAASSSGWGNSGSNGILKVIYCLSPPAPFYEDPKLTEEVEFTTQHDWSASIIHPRFLDGLHAYRDINPEASLGLVLDVKIITFKKEKFSVENYGWGILPVLDGAFVRNGYHQVPIFEGAPTRELLEEMQIETPSKVIERELKVSNKKKAKMIIRSNHCSVLVKLVDAQLEDVLELPPSEIDRSLLPEKNAAKFMRITTGKETKKLLSKIVPKGQTAADFEKQANRAFAEDTEITHYAWGEAPAYEIVDA